MNLLGILTVLLFVMVGAGAGASILSKYKNNSTASVMSLETPTPTPTEEPTVTPGQSEEGRAPTITPRVTQSEEKNSAPETVWVYPNSVKVGSNDGRVVLQSSDNSKAITDWYKNRINSLGMNATSFIQTSTNDTVLNSLVGSDGQREVKVEISRNAGDSVTKITVTDS